MRWPACILAILLLSPAARCAGPQRGSVSPDGFSIENADDILKRLRAAGWDAKVGSNMGLWVSVERQALFGIRDGRIVFRYPCSTAQRGVGSREHTNLTPLGWHEIDERFGDGLPVGAVFKEREYTGRVWDPEQPIDGDLILSRIMWLRGLEDGKNCGPGVDSHDRFIYIHGTPYEERLGAPASLGCVRLSNEDVVAVFDATRTGTRLLVTEW